MFVNDYEIGLIQKKTGLGMTELLNRVDIIVVTKGADGAVIYSKGNEIYIPVIQEERVVDPTGVGDAFRGGFLSGYAHGWDLEFCARIGSLAAVYCLEQNGTQNHHYTVDEFKSRFRKNFDDDGRLDSLTK